MARPLSARKMDALYLVFFCIHIPIMFFVDFSTLYPPWLAEYTLRDFMVEMYADHTFVDPPAWFRVFIVGEVVYHLPVSVWMIGAILGDHVLVPLNLLIFALETGITTAVCVTDVASWPAYTEAQRNALYSIYVPYLALGVIMGVDAFMRVKQQILSTRAKGKTT